MLTIASEVASLGVSPPRQRLEGDDDDDDEATCGCLPSRQRSRAYGCCVHLERGSIDVILLLLL